MPDSNQTDDHDSRNHKQHHKQERDAAPAASRKPARARLILEVLTHEELGAALVLHAHPLRVASSRIHATTTTALPKSVALVTVLTESIFSGGIHAPSRQAEGC